MVRYKVKVPFVDFGIHHAVDSTIADVTLINNKDVKLWDGTIVMLDDDGKEIPFKKVSQARKIKVVSPKVDPNKVTPKAEKVEKVTKVVLNNKQEITKSAATKNDTSATK